MKGIELERGTTKNKSKYLALSVRIGYTGNEREQGYDRKSCLLQSAVHVDNSEK